MERRIFVWKPKVLKVNLLKLRQKSERNEIIMFQVAERNTNFLKII